MKKIITIIMAMTFMIGCMPNKEVTNENEGLDGELEGDIKINNNLNHISIRDEKNGFQVDIPRGWEIGAEEIIDNFIYRKFYYLDESVEDRRDSSTSNQFYELKIIDSENYENKPNQVVKEYNHKKFILTANDENKEALEKELNSLILFSPNFSDDENIWYIDSYFGIKFKYNRDWYVSVNGNGNALFYSETHEWENKRAEYNSNDQFVILSLNQKKDTYYYDQLHIDDYDKFGFAEQDFLNNGIIYNFLTNYDIKNTKEKSLTVIENMMSSLVFSVNKN